MPTDELRPPMPGEDLKVSMALSGGGHRATAWGLGAVYGLVLGRAAESAKSRPRITTITSIASVSGGSIANGVIGQQFQDLNAVAPGELLTGTRAAIRHIARDGLIFPARRTDGYVKAILFTAISGLVLLVADVCAGLSAGRDWSWWTLLLPTASLAAILFVMLVLRARRGAPEPAKPRRLQVVAVVALGATSACGLLLGRVLHGWAALIAVIAIAAAAACLLTFAVVLASRRGRVVERELAHAHFHSDDDVPTRLSALKDRTVHHVFCATELQSGEHLYMSPKLLHSYRLGEGPPEVTLARAVQATAALPGGFPPQETEIAAPLSLERPWRARDAPAQLRRRMVLVDGGVYDNMGDEWALGFAARAERSSRVRDAEPAPNFLVIANAGKSLGAKPMRPTNLLIRELRGLTRDQQVQYDATTAQRRRSLVARFIAAEATGKGLIGVIAHIDTTPHDVCDAFVDGSDPKRQARAREWLAALGDDPTSRDSWRELADRNAAVGTVLHALGDQTTLELLHHAVTLTVTALYVIHGLGTVGVPNQDELREALLTD